MFQSQCPRKAQHFLSFWEFSFLGCFQVWLMKIPALLIFLSFSFLVPEKKGSICHAYSQIQMKRENECESAWYIPESLHQVRGSSRFTPHGHVPPPSWLRAPTLGCAPFPGPFLPASCRFQDSALCLSCVPSKHVCNVPWKLVSLQHTQFNL